MRIFVAGLSKSGKTTRSRYLTEQIADLDYVSVSSLLKSVRALPVLTIQSALDNQRIATDLVLSQPRSSEHQLIDGHALIETPEGPVIVPDYVFDEIAPDLIVYVRDNPEDILSRRKIAPALPTASEIASLADMEHAVCQRIASIRTVPLVVLASPTLQEFHMELSRRLKADQ